MPDRAPSSQFDFIMKEPAKPKRSLPLTNLPKWAIGLIAGIMLILLLSIYGVLTGGPKVSDKYQSIVATASEIARVSDIASQNARSDDTQHLASTVSAVMNSQAQSMTSYLQARKVKIKTKGVVTGLDPTIDSKLNDSTVTNSYDQTYLSYLKTSLGTYQSELKDAFTAASPSAQAILSDDYSNNLVLLNSPGLK